MNTGRIISRDGTEVMGRYYSIYRGYVADRKDPDKSGRLKLRIPQVYGGDIHDYWAFPKGLYTSPDNGSVVIPEKGALVWVEFEAGDVRFPVWSYGPWVTGKVVAEAYDESGEPAKSVVKTPNPYSIIAPEVHLSELEGKEPAVLGDTLKALLEDYNDEVIKITVNTAMGPSSVPINIAQLSAIIAKLSTILSSKVKLS